MIAALGGDGVGVYFTISLFSRKILVPIQQSCLKW